MDWKIFDRPVRSYNSWEWRDAYKYSAFFDPVSKPEKEKKLSKRKSSRKKAKMKDIIEHKLNSGKRITIKEMNKNIILLLVEGKYVEVKLGDGGFESPDGFENIKITRGIVVKEDENFWNSSPYYVLLCNDPFETDDPYKEITINGKGITVSYNCVYDLSNILYKSYDKIRILKEDEHAL